MPYINFDCPECGHNLEVDERGAGFIVKCPECNNPLQIPEIPVERKRRKLWFHIFMVLVAAALVVTNLGLWMFARQMEAKAKEVDGLQEALAQAQFINMEQAEQWDRLVEEVETAQESRPETLPDVIQELLSEAIGLTQQVNSLSEGYVQSNPNARTALLREHMREAVQVATNDITPPIFTDTAPDKGIQGRLIVFPELLSSGGTVLHTNATITEIDGDKISVQFDAGAASYKLSALHPGIAAYLPVDPLLALPQNQWTAEARRILKMQQTRRDERMEELRHQLLGALPE